MVKKKDEPEPVPAHDGMIDLAAQIVTAYVSKNQAMQPDIGPFMKSVYGALAELRSGKAHIVEEVKPAVSIKKSVTDEYLVCLHDGQHLTMLKRYLMTHYHQTPEQYRKQFGLPHDYPMVAPAYARLRSAFAKKIGLGRVPGGGRKKK